MRRGCDLDPLSERFVPPRIAVIVSTYNRPDALRSVLVSLNDQRYREFEVFVADDGSGDDTRSVVEAYRAETSIPIRHVWQEDRGFRLAAVRNRAAAAATDAEYLVFIDGDCAVRPDYMLRHARLAERGFYVKGSRVNLSEGLSARVLREQLPIHLWPNREWYSLWRQGEINRFAPVLRVPLGPLRKLSLTEEKGALGSNFALWRGDYLAVNGFNEAFEGYGFEDWEIVVRLLRYGLKRKNGRLAVSVLHLWHESRSIAPGSEQVWEAQLESESIRTEKGVDRYL